MRAWVLALALAGCGFSSPAVSDGRTDTPVPIDATVDSPDVAPGELCLGTFVNVCVPTPQGALMLTTQVLNTSSSKLCGTYRATPAADVCVVTAQVIAIPTGNTVTVTGGRPLILLASDSITISGTLDAASRRGGNTGPAADRGPCPTNTTDPTTGVQGGGAWGGTFGGPGSNGGNTPDGGVGGVAGSALAITALGGGCAGGTGANNSAGVGGGLGGHGGGSVMLVAGQLVTIDGTVNASGAGASGGRTGGGGGGGGAGGQIVLEAPSVKVPGTCYANGGGGAEGASTVRDGARGNESPAPDMAGTGGKGNALGGDGGDGAFADKSSSPGKNGTSSNSPIDAGGGGGGGGGTGIIKIFAGTQEHTGDLKHVAPPPS